MFHLTFSSQFYNPVGLSLNNLVLRDSVTRILFELQLKGFRLGPTDVPEQLLTAVNFSRDTVP